ncbi:MAG TPA: outer membrane beta-barrel protein [Candidatus Acidoferrum sp.]|jgi:outer membrane immunogenic protein|nr:outer membrane beta-barrel protein [Candidatus Acidoferrum sp.]
MKRLLKYLASAAMLLSPLTAHSADLAYPPPPLPVPIFSWTGFYVGGNIGGAWAKNEWTDSLFLTNFNNVNNGVFIGGGQLGGNYQIGSFVIGGEWDFDWAGNNNGTGVITPAGNILVSSNNRWITTVAARFGYAIDHWMVYGKVGGGWVGNNDFTATNLTTGVSVTCGTFANVTCNNSAGGWLVGAGFEYALTNHWTVKLEYDFLGLGNRTFVIPATAPLLAGDTFTSNNRNVQVIKVGFNYLWNWGAWGAPVAARY